MNRAAVVSLIILAIAAVSVAATATGSTRSGSAEAGAPGNVTVAVKNREFPLKVRMTVQPCAIAPCIDV